MRNGAFEPTITKHLLPNHPTQHSVRHRTSRYFCFVGQPTDFQVLEKTH
jgi:hypothetical protein